MCSVNRRSKFIWQRNRTAKQEQRGDGKTCTLASWGLLLWHQHKGCTLYCPCSYCHHLLQAKFPVSGLLVSGSTKGWMFPKGEEVSGIPQASRAGTCQPGPCPTAPKQCELGRSRDHGQVEVRIHSPVLHHGADKAYLRSTRKWGHINPWIYGVHKHQ